MATTIAQRRLAVVGPCVYFRPGDHVFPRRSPRLVGRRARFGGSDPSDRGWIDAIVKGMTRSHGIEGRASELLAVAREFQSEAEQTGSHIAAPDALDSLAEAFQAMSAAWYQLAADAVPRTADGDAPPTGARMAADGLPREAEVRLVATLHDIAAGFARCGRTCREGRRLAARLIGRAMAADRADGGEAGDGRTPAEDGPATIECAA
jgi:hypothetical protein